MSGFLLLVIVYAASAVFLIVFTLRTVRIARMPIHLRWELAPVPHERGKSSYGGSYLEEYEWWTKPRERSELNGIIYMAKEIFLLKGVWEHNRPLWPYSFAFHTGIYLLVLMAGLLFTASILMFFTQTLSAGRLFLSAAGVPAAAGYLLGSAGCAGLMIKRAIDPHLRPFNTLSTYLNLAILLLLFASGGLAFLLIPDFSCAMSSLFTSLITLQPPAGVPPALSLHVMTAALFIAWLPFTHMIHFMAKFFLYHEVRWNDRPQDEASERKVQALLAQPLSWSAPHINGEGKKTWMDAATEDKDDE